MPRVRGSLHRAKKSSGLFTMLLSEYTQATWTYTRRLQRVYNFLTTVRGRVARLESNALLATTRKRGFVQLRLLPYITACGLTLQASDAKAVSLHIPDESGNSLSVARLQRQTAGC